MYIFIKGSLTMKEKRKTIRTRTILAVGLSIILLTNAVFALTGAWFSDQTSGESGSETFGIIQVAPLEGGEGVSQQSTNLDLLLMPGDDMEIDFTARNTGNAEAWFRFRIIVMGPGASALQADMMNSLKDAFTEGEVEFFDENFFYIGSIEGGQELEIQDTFTLSTEITNVYQGRQIQFRILLQAVQRANNAQQSDINGIDADWSTVPDPYEGVEFLLDPEDPTVLLNYIGDETEVAVPEGIETIGDLAFYNMGIEQVTLPEGLESIGEYAFADNELEEITIPASVTHIGYRAFYGNNLTSVTIDGDESRFNSIWGSIGLPSGEIPTGGEEPGEPEEYEMLYMDITDYITVVDGVITDFDYPAHEGPEILQLEISIPMEKDGQVITAIGDGDWDESEGIFGTPNYDRWGGNRNINISKVQFPPSLEIIGEASFMWVKIEDLILPESLTTIKRGAFEESGIENISIPESLITIEIFAVLWNHITNLVIADGVEYIGDSAFIENEIEVLVIGEGVKTIGKWAFGHNSLESITIGSSVESIGVNAFHYNYNSINEVIIRSKKIIEELSEASSHGGILDHMIQGGELYIPSSATEIGSYIISNFNLAGTKDLGGVSFDRYVKN